MPRIANFLDIHPVVGNHGDLRYPGAFVHPGDPVLNDQAGGKQVGVLAHL